MPHLQLPAIGLAWYLACTQAHFSNEPGYEASLILWKGGKALTINDQ